MGEVGRERSGGRDRRRPAGTRTAALALVAALALAVPSGTAQGDELPAAPPAPTAAAQPDPRHAVLPPAPLPPATPVTTRIDPVTFDPGARDATGVRQARATTPLKLVAVTWNGVGPDAVSLRSTDAAGQWGAWTALDPAGSERDDQPARAPHGGTDPVWVGDRTAVEVRATRGGAPVTDGVQLVRLDPGLGVNDDAIGRAARGPAAPAYVTRAQWGADESMMTWPPESAPTVRAVTIHHTSESNDYGPGDSAGIVRAIYAYHARTQGWGDIGYNALVDKYGTIFEGRAGGLDKPVVAAHAGGFNRETFGIAMMGNLATTPPTPEEMASVAALGAWKLGGSYRDPAERVTLTSSGGGTSRFPKGQSTTVPALFAHRDVGNTACPGDAAYGQMDALRARVGQLIAASATDVRAAWATDRSALGEPTRVESTTADGAGRATDFERGSVYWTPRTGAWPVTGAIATAWRAEGAERSSLGYPTSAEYDVPAGRQQNFEHGALTWNRATAAVAPPV